MARYRFLSSRCKEAKDRGAKAGKERARWAFDGNTTDATYRRTLQGIEDGDPEVLDSLDWSPLSGEWAGESIPELVGDLILNEDDHDEIESAYEDAARDAYWQEIERTCRAMLVGKVRHAGDGSPRGWATTDLD